MIKWTKKYKRDYDILYSRKYRKNHQEWKREYNKKWQENNINYNKYWGKENRNYLNEYMRKRKQSNLKFHLDGIMATAICKILKGQKEWRKWESLVGYKIEDLMKYLEKQFNDKMSWDNYGSYWEVDHIKPKSLFHYEKPESEEFKKCWALNNLQPLEKTANRKKHNNFKVVK